MNRFLGMLIFFGITASTLVFLHPILTATNLSFDYILAIKIFVLIVFISIPPLIIFSNDGGEDGIEKLGKPATSLLYLMGHVLKTPILVVIVLLLIIINILLFK